RDHDLRVDGRLRRVPRDARGRRECPRTGRAHPLLRSGCAPRERPLPGHRRARRRRHRLPAALPTIMTRLALVLLLLIAATPARAATPGPGVVSSVTAGKSLFAANCARCHGPRGQGTEDDGPSLDDAGARGADFYVRTGYMPLDDPHSQPWR